MNIQQAVRTYTGNPDAAKVGEEKLQEMLARSATDMEFRARLLNDPRAAVAEFTGREVPEGVTFRFIENKGSATVVLPDPIDPRAELSDSDLEAVAGGATPVVVATLVLAAEVIGVAAMGITSD